MEKQDRSSAYRLLHSPNIKSHKRGLKLIKQFKKNQKTR